MHTGGWGGGMITFVALAHMVDATSLTLLVALAHMVDATSLTLVVAHLRCLHLRWAISCNHVFSLKDFKAEGWKSEGLLLAIKKALEMSKCWMFDHSNSNSYNNRNLWPKSHSTKLLVCLHPKLNEWPYFSVLMTCYFFDASQKRTVIALSKQTFPTKQKSYVWFCPVKYNGLCYVPNSSTCRCQHNTTEETT